MKNQTLKLFQIAYLLIFTLIIVYFNFIVDFDFGDDVRSKGEVLSWDLLVHYYNSWTSRIIPAFFQFYMVHHPGIFRITNSVIMVLTPIATWVLIDKNKKLGNLTLIVMLFLFYDYSKLRSAGIITTYTNYYWNLFANILYYICIRRCLNASRLFSIDLIFAVTVGVIACQMELAALANLIILCIFFIFEYTKKRTVNKRILFLVLVPFLSVLFIITCPGNFNRSVAENTWFPEFSSYSFVYKLYLGLSDTFLHYFNNKYYLLMIFLGALSVSVIQNNLSTSYVFLSLFCLAGVLFVRNSSDLIVRFSNVSNVKPYLFLMFLMCFCCFVLFIIYKIYENNVSVFLLLTLVLLIGLMTRVAIGFTPTLYVPRTRTFTYCDYALLVVTYYIIKSSKSDLDELSPVFLTFLAYPYFISDLFTTSY